MIYVVYKSLAKSQGMIASTRPNWSQERRDYCERIVFHLYINGTHLLSIARGKCLSIPFDSARVMPHRGLSRSLSCLYKRDTYSGQRTRWLWEKRTPCHQSWSSETASPIRPSPWCPPCWCPGPAGCSPLQIVMILLIDAITPLLLRSSHRNWVRRKKKEKGYLRLADITKSVQKICRFSVKLYVK